jgi:hypothetical protein
MAKLYFPPNLIYPEIDMAVMVVMGEYEKKYKKNKLLIILCVIGFIWFIYWLVFSFLFNSFHLPIYLQYIRYLFLPVAPIGAILTYYDAKKICGNRNSFKDKTFDIKTWSPLTWALIVFLLFPLSLLFYIYKRYDLFLDGLRYYYENIEPQGSGVDG